ncbi:MAG: thioredoxin fold domain-containing protein [Gammaproteobacteria bacterium]|nr:thioredoxin fold domain-containing protein [Gammaproteobacteria bacterium]
MRYLAPYRNPNRAVGSLLGSLLLLISIGLGAAPPDGYRFLSYGDALIRAGEQDKPVFLYFGRYGCSVCLKMHQEVFTDEQVKSRFNSHYVLAYVDTEGGERVTLPNGERITEMQLASRTRILGTPTFFFIAPDQRPLIKLSGFQSIENMVHYDDYISGRHYQTQSLREFLAKQ